MKKMSVIIFSMSVIMGSVAQAQFGGNGGCSYPDCNSNDQYNELKAAIEVQAAEERANGATKPTTEDSGSRPGFFSEMSKIFSR